MKGKVTDLWEDTQETDNKSCLLGRARVVLSTGGSKIFLLCFHSFVFEPYERVSYLNVLDWSLADLQCGVSFRYTAKCFKRIFIYSFLDSCPIWVITEYWVETWLLPFATFVPWLQAHLLLTMCAVILFLMFVCLEPLWGYLFIRSTWECRMDRTASRTRE